ncbi:MAG: LysM peptidoglycan-binding domain-containing protein [Lachnospiraceae bacterium]
MRNIQHTLESRPVIKRMILLVGTLIVILLCTFALSTIATAKHTQAAQRGTQTTYVSIRIAGGDSLWSIAQEYRGIEETADFVEELKILNNLSSDRIQAGSYILVPVTSVL